jgi:hypothetical protein
MTIARLPIPTSHPVRDLLRQNDALAALVAFVKSLLAGPRIVPDTSIAWEDGETEERSETKH